MSDKVWGLVEWGCVSAGIRKDQPCWGEVKWVDDCITGCEGHADQIAYGEAYKPMPEGYEVPE